MIDKKYTNKDIISSLEVIATTCNCNECKIRSGKWGTCNCSETSANAALGLINRQQEEIDNLREHLKRVCAERDARICTNNFIKSSTSFCSITDKIPFKYLNMCALHSAWVICVFL